MVKERKGNWKKDEFGFGIFRFRVPKRHISEQVQGPAQNSPEIKTVWYLKFGRAKGRAQGPNK